MPRVSIITPCYNSEHYVGDTIKSISTQSFNDWEHIVVDDGSTDGSRAVIQAYLTKDSRIRLVTRPNGGMVQARLSGFQAASPSSDYLLFLDADDCAEFNMLERLVSYLDSHPKAGLVHCGFRFIGSGGDFIHYNYRAERLVPSGLWLRRLRAKEQETPLLSVFTLCPIISSIAFMRRSIYEKAGGYDESFGIHREDTDLFLRMALFGEVHFFSEELVRRRRHPNQDTAGSKEFKQRAYEQTQKLYAQWKKGERLTTEQKKIVKAAWRFKQGRVEPYQAFLRANDYLREGKLIKALQFYLGGCKYYLIYLFSFDRFMDT